MIYVSQIFTRLFSSFRGINPLCSYCLTAPARLFTTIRYYFCYGTVIYSPKFTEFSVTKFLSKVPQFNGIANISTLNKFNSAYHFWTQTFFHNRYIIVSHKNTEKYNGKVYNLSVVDDESYITQLGIAHNCRCKAIEVLAADYKTSSSNDAIEKGRNATGRKTKNGKEPDAMFRFNPGQDKKLFPPKNGYVPKNCDGSKTNLSHLIGYADIVLQNEGERCKAYQLIKQEARKVQRKKIKAWAKENLQGKTFDINGEKAELNGVGIKEIINQPHKHYEEKNAVLYDFENICKSAKKTNSMPSSHNDDFIKHVDAYKIDINNEPSWILVKEFKDGKRLIYSIVDRLKKQND